MNQSIQETDRIFSNYEWMDIGEKLENFHSIFQKFWALGKPRFTKSIPTATVFFDRLGDCIDFNINPDFWDTLDDEQKLFIICHEVTHVLFYHGFRITNLKTPAEMKIANLGLDIVVNHFLTDFLGFDREMVDPENKLCWIDTVFQEVKKRPMTGQNFEYYYNLIKQEIEKNPNGKMAQMTSMDDHESLESFLNQSFEQKMKDSLDRTDQDALDASPKMKEIAKKELEAQGEKPEKGGKEAGINPGNSWIIAKKKLVIKKRKWESVVKDWILKTLEEKYGEQWQKPHRRLVNMPKDFMIPAEHEIEEYEKKKIPVFFFLDTSGSCAHLAERFFNAAESIPEDRFILHLACFDTRVYETDLKTRKLYGFGGTSFTCIEQYIQKKTKEERMAYPDAIWVLTDGMGDNVKPEKPERWKWFLSENYRSCIPSQSKVYMLKDYE